MSGERPGLEWGLLAGGALLIIASLAFIWVLPEDPVLLPEFTVRFTEQTVDSALDDVVLQGAPVSVPFEVVLGNLTRIEVVVELTDDVPASDPDDLTVEITAAGQPINGSARGATPLAQWDGSLPPNYRASARQIIFSVVISDRPSTQVVVALSMKETAGEVAARISNEVATPLGGPWALRFTLASGDCPDPVADPPRAANCRSQQPDGIDAGNSVRIVSLRTYHFQALVEPRTK